MRKRTLVFILLLLMVVGCVQVFQNYPDDILIKQPPASTLTFDSSERNQVNVTRSSQTENVESQMELATELAVLPSPTPTSERNFQIGIFDPEFPPKSNLLSWEEQLNLSFDILAWYQHWDQPGSTNKLQYTCELGKTPLITWEPWGGRSAAEFNPYSLDEVAAGVFDELLIKHLSDLMSTAREYGCTQVWLRFAHEMNTPRGEVHWYPWQGSPEDYVAAWQHVVDLTRDMEWHELKWIWAPAWGNEDAILYYPGDGYVDYVGLTINQYWRNQIDFRVDKWDWRSWEEMYQVNNPVVESFGKPIVIAETATGEGPQESSKADWISELFQVAEANDQIKAVVWFNAYHAREFEDINFRIDSTENSLNAFKNLNE